MSDKLETTAKTDRGNTKNGEESFKEEIKDYAKTTMNELLGMFGYDDEMTSESVNNLEIKVPSTGEESSTATPSISTVTVTTPSLPLTVPDDTSDDAPVIVKVEGNTSVTDIIRQQNGANASTNGTPPTLSLQVTSATPTSVTKAAMPMNVTMTTQSETGQPALAPHFYAVPPAVRGLYCVVANLPLVVNQNKSAMTFKFWNCITCSEYFLKKPEVVFRVHYPHLFTGQPEWLYQAAVCLKCYHTLKTTVVPKTTTIPESLALATFTVVDCKMEEKECSTTTVNSTSAVSGDNSLSKERKSPETPIGNPPGHKEKLLVSSNGESPAVSVSNGKETSIADGKGNHPSQVNVQKHQISNATSKGNLPSNAAPQGHYLMDSHKGSPPSSVALGNHISMDTSKGHPPSQVALQGHISSIQPTGNPLPHTGNPPTSTKPEQGSGNGSEDIESMEENHSETQESYKCYVCNVSVSVTSPHGKLRRSKFSSLFTDVPDNVGHFKVCQKCFDRLDRQREHFINANVPDEERDYITPLNQSEPASKTCSVDLCFICEAALDDKEPSRLIFRSRYSSLFRGLPNHVIHVPICDKCYKKLQKVKLRFDSSQHEENSRNYIQFVNMWRAKRGLGKHPVLV